jgi:3-oxoadipate enol-lactonase
VSLVWGSWERCCVPTLIIAGGQDSHVDQDRLAEMAALIPDCRLVTIPAGHSVHAVQPDLFIAAVTEFLPARPY